MGACTYLCTYSLRDTQHDLTPIDAKTATLKAWPFKARRLSYNAEI